MAASAAVKSAKWLEKISRRLFIGGNWKCNGTITSSAKLVSETVNKVTFDPKKMEVLVSPIFVHLFDVKKMLTKKVHLSAQNISPFNSGPFTGEVSAEQLKDFGINWTLIGHSERRTYFKESNNVRRDLRSRVGDSHEGEGSARTWPERSPLHRRKAGRARVRQNPRHLPQPSRRC